MVNGLSPWGGITYLFGVIVRVRVVFRKTVVGDWRFDYLSGSHLQSQVKSCCQMMVFMPLVLVWIDQFCHDMIGRQNLNVAVIDCLKFCCYFQSIYCLFVSFVWGYVWVVLLKVQVAVDIGSEVLFLNLCTLQVGPLFLQIHTNLNPLKVFTSSR